MIVQTDKEKKIFRQSHLTHLELQGVRVRLHHRDDNQTARIEINKWKKTLATNRAALQLAVRSLSCLSVVFNMELTSQTSSHITNRGNDLAKSEMKIRCSTSAGASFQKAMKMFQL